MPAAPESDCLVIVDCDTDFGSPPLTVRFETEIDCTSSPVTYSWDFGDGNTGGNLPKPTHTYETAGDFVAVVRVTAADGAESDDEIDIAVGPMLPE